MLRSSRMLVRVTVYEPSKDPFESVRIPPSSTHIRLLVDGSTKDRFHQLPIAKLSILRILRAETFDLYCYHLDEIIRQQYNETNKTRKQSKHYIEKKKTNNVGQHL